MKPGNPGPFPIPISGCNASTGGLEAGAAKRDASPKGKKQPKDMGEKPTKMPMSMKKGKR